MKKKNKAQYSYLVSQVVVKEDKCPKCGSKNENEISLCWNKDKIERAMCCIKCGCDYTEIYNYHFIGVDIEEKKTKRTYNGKSIS